jgi:HEPN domain-containing protein
MFARHWHFAASPILLFINRLNLASMLTCYNTMQLKKVVAMVTTTAPTEKIFLLAVQTNCRAYENIFTSLRASCSEVTHYYLLVLLEANRHRSNECWQDMIEHRCRPLTPVTTWVLPVATFAQWLEAGQPFAARACRGGILCYDAGRTLLPEPVEDSAMEDDALRKECVHYLGRSAGFLEGAGLYYLRRQFRLAAFLLHQAAEQAYIAINWRATGFRPMVHSLEKLHRYALPFSSELARVFPQNSKQEEWLFGLLQKAYIDTRYTPDYTIREPELLGLTGKVQRLHDIATELCSNIMPPS